MIINLKASRRIQKLAICLYIMHHSGIVGELFYNHDGSQSQEIP
jgi:hypothetical protein